MEALRSTSYFTQGWQYAESHPTVICPDVPPTIADPQAPLWADGEWVDGFLSQRDTMSTVSKVEDCSPSAAQRSALNKKKGKR